MIEKSESNIQTAVAHLWEAKCGTAHFFLKHINWLILAKPKILTKNKIKWKVKSD